MASRSFSEEDLICPLCCDIFINPVLLSCNHSVCRNCIQMFWENQESKECPVCSRRSSKDYPPVHFALKKHCETFLEERRQKWSSGICSVHKGKLKLFCLDDQELVCFMCRDLRKHTNHKFYPADEAMIENKEKLKAALKPLQEKLRTFESVKQSFSQTAEQIKIDAQRTERQIKAEFEELHQFLRNEEAARITTLREEEKQESHIMMEKIEETSKQISSLTRTIRDIEEQIKYEDISFLQNFKSMLHRAQCNLLVPDRSPVVTINFSNHLRNLKLTVLQKMQEKIGETTHFNTDHSNFHTAMEIFNNPVKHTKYKRFPRGRGNSTKLFRGKKSKKGPQQVPWEVHHATSKTPHPVHTMQLSYDRPKFPEQHPQYEITETTACNQTNHPTTSHKRHVKNRPGNIKDQNPDIQFPVVKDLVRKINEQMKM